MNILSNVYPRKSNPVLGYVFSILILAINNFGVQRMQFNLPHLQDWLRIVFWVLGGVAALSAYACLVWSFCSSDWFAAGFLSIPPCDGRPYLTLCARHY